MHYYEKGIRNIFLWGHNLWYYDLRSGTSELVTLDAEDIDAKIFEFQKKLYY